MLYPPQNLNLPPILDFGSVNVGDSSSQTLTITNAGTADLIIRQTTIGGTNSYDLAIQNNQCGSTTLRPSQICTIQILFSPISTGAKNANLSISSNDPATPTKMVPLAGTSSGVVSTSTGTSCFCVVTAVGAGYENFLDALRRFRDEFSIESSPGKRLVDFYYQISPPLARFVSRHDFLRAVVRADSSRWWAFPMHSSMPRPREKEFSSF